MLESVPEFKSRDEIFKRGKAKSTKARAIYKRNEILDEADIVYRYDWACIDAMLKKEPAPAGLDGEVVQERRRMLNWLINYETAAWDDVRTDA
ncbi:MAG: DUF4272 domain-containing protein [Candidatus Accumulibacter sp.]|nr:DUF4272 domain-containing protein [Accumulibacter sp.]